LTQLCEGDRKQERSIQDTAYPRLKSNITDLELATIYTPTDDELALAEQMTKGSAAKLGFLIVLKTFQRLGYAVLGRVLKLLGRIG